MFFFGFLSVIGSLGEFASLPGMPSEPTLRNMIRDYPEFPLIERGTNGREYRIDFTAAADFIRGIRAKEDEVVRARVAEVRQFGLQLIGGDAIAAPTVGLTPAEQRAVFETELFATKLAEKRGELVRKAVVDEALGALVVWFQQHSASLSARLAKRGEFTREQLAVIDAVIAQDQHELADRMEQIGTTTHVSSPDRDTAI